MFNGARAWRFLRTLPRSQSLAFGLAVGLLSSGSGCSLVLDFSSDPDAAVVDANPRCLAFEDNNTRDDAAALDGDGPTQAAICGSADIDYYLFEVMPNEDTVIQLDFTDGAGTGDLGLRLFAVGQPTAIAVANGTTDQERIERTGLSGTQLAPGFHEIEVAPTNNGNEAEYTLTVTLTNP